MPGSWRGGGAEMVFMLAVPDGSGGKSPGTATPPRPLIRLCDLSLCRAKTARAECRVINCKRAPCGSASESTLPRRYTGSLPLMVVSGGTGHVVCECQLRQVCRPVGRS